MEIKNRMRTIRTISSDYQTREEDGDIFIEGYFSVFNSPYEMWPGATEYVAPGAFANTLGGDIRALTNHDTTLVLGRNTAGTLELREDSHGLWGRIRINRNDTDAVNLYERVKRGDVDQCSFGFEILDEDVEYRDDGSVVWTIREVRLHEVSVCTFPAYEATGVSARNADFENAQKRRADLRRAEIRKKLKGVT